MKKFGIVILSFLVSISLSVALTIYVLNSTLGNKQTVQSWLDESDIIGRAVQNVLLLADNEDFNLELDREQKLDIGERLRGPVADKVLKPQAERAVGFFYDWLDDGQYDKLNFTIQLDANNAEIIKKIGGIITDYYDELPKCTAAQLAKLEGEDSNKEGEDEEFILCRDPKVNATKLADEITEMLTDNEGLLEPVEVSYEDGSEADDVLNNVYDGVSLVRGLHVLFIMAVLLFSVPIVFLAKSYLHGAKRLSRSFINILILPVLFALIVLLFMPDSMFLDKVDFDYTGNNPEAFEAAVVDTFSPFAREVVMSMVRAYLKVAFVLLLIAGGTWFYTRHLVKQREKKEDKKNK